jgi:monoamine oxidase
MKYPNRRHVLAGAAAFAASPSLAQSPGQMPSGEVDVAIIGAGAAGIAAARRVASAGRSYAVFEAHNRIGGRVWTTAGSLGTIHDRGAHRLTASGRNPLVSIGRLAGVKFYDPAPFRRLYVGLREARDSGYDNFTAALHRASRAITAAGEAGLDLSAARTLPDLGDWGATVSFVLGPLQTSKDLEEVSTLDFSRSEEHPDELVCQGGMGRLLAAAAGPLNVNLETAVTRVDSRGRGSIAIETTRGTVRAATLIVTASTSALSANYIRFEQPLPKRFADALAGLSLGTHDRLIFQLSAKQFGFANDQRVIFRTSDDRTIALVGNVGGADLAYAEFCGRFGREMSNAGDAAMRDFVAETLSAHFGADAKNFIGRSESVRWSRAPWILGAISAAAPGSGMNRRILAEPIYDRIFLAGEALHESWWGTVAGAWVSGERAADAALRKAVPSPPPPARKRRK